MAASSGPARQIHHSRGLAPGPCPHRSRCVFRLFFPHFSGFRHSAPRAPLPGEPPVSVRAPGSSWHRRGPASPPTPGPAPQPPHGGPDPRGPARPGPALPVPRRRPLRSPLPSLPGRGRKGRAGPGVSRHSPLGHAAVAAPGGPEGGPRPPAALGGGETGTGTGTLFPRAKQRWRGRPAAAVHGRPGHHPPGACSGPGAAVCEAGAVLLLPSPRLLPVPSPAQRCPRPWLVSSFVAPPASPQKSLFLLCLFEEMRVFAPCR